MRKVALLALTFSLLALPHPAAHADSAPAARELTGLERASVGQAILATIAANINNIRCKGATISSDLGSGDAIVMKGAFFLWNSQDMHFPVLRQETSLFVEDQTHTVTALTSADDKRYLPYTAAPTEGHELYEASWTFSDDGLLVQSMKFTRSKFIKKDAQATSLTQTETGSATCSDLDYVPVSE